MSRESLWSHGVSSRGFRMVYACRTFLLCLSLTQRVTDIDQATSPSCGVGVGEEVTQLWGWAKMGFISRNLLDFRLSKTWKTHCSKTNMPPTGWNYCLVIELMDSPIIQQNASAPSVRIFGSHEWAVQLRFWASLVKLSGPKLGQFIHCLPRAIDHRHVSPIVCRSIDGLYCHNAIVAGWSYQQQML